MKKEEAQEHSFMIVVIGDSSVGKSCLLRKFIRPQSQVEEGQHVATVGVDFINKSIQILDKKVKLQVWDTAG